MSLLVPALALSLVVAGPVTADVGGYLERSAEAEYWGEQLISCETPAGSISAVFNLAQVDGGVVAWDDSQGAPLLRVAPGVSIQVEGGHSEATMVEGTISPEVDRYEIDSSTDTTYLGRAAHEVVLARDDAPRVRLVVDDRTDAILRTVTLENGVTYCDRRLLSFSSDLGGVPTVDLPPEGKPSEPIGEVPELLPEQAHGFELIDTYEVADGTLSYYSDGFFSAGVVVTSRPIAFPEGDAVSEVSTDRGRYRRAYQPGSATVAWESGGDNLAVIGDLPPDLMESFVSALPAPTDSGFFGRLWRRLFG